MMTTVQPYIDAILQQRSWSWAVVCILYILAAFFVRGWFMNPLSVQLKTLDRDRAHQIKKAYLKASFLGWIFFLFPIVIIALAWRKDFFPIRVADNWMIALGITSYVLSVLFHLQAFAQASLSALHAQQQAQLQHEV